MLRNIPVYQSRRTVVPLNIFFCDQKASPNNALRNAPTLGLDARVRE